MCDQARADDRVPFNEWGKTQYPHPVPRGRVIGEQ